MRITVSAIPEGGQLVPFDRGVPWATSAAAAALDGDPTTVSGVLEFNRERSLVKVSGHVAASRPHACERCGEDTVLAVDADVDLVYEPVARKTDEGEEIDDGMVDDKPAIGWYEDDTLDAESVLCEAIALASPERIACPDVTSCDIRTADLLRSKGSSGDPSPSAFAALKKLR